MDSIHRCGIVGEFIKAGLSPTQKKKDWVTRLIDRTLKMMKNAFYFILEALFVLKIFKFLSRLFGHLEKTARLGRYAYFQNL